MSSGIQAFYPGARFLQAPAEGTSGPLIGEPLPHHASGTDSPAVQALARVTRDLLEATQGVKAASPAGMPFPASAVLVTPDQLRGLIAGAQQALTTAEGQMDTAKAAGHQAELKALIAISTTLYTTINNALRSIR